MFRPPIVVIFRVVFLKDVLHKMLSSLQRDQQTQQHHLGLDGATIHTKKNA